MAGSVYMTGIGVEIYGVQQLRNKLGEFDKKARPAQITRALSGEARLSAAAIRRAIEIEHTEGSGRVAKSIGFTIEGGRIEFTVGAFKEVRYMSAIGGDRRPGPYVILPVRKRKLYFFWKRMGRKVMFSRVLHPGFPIDVLQESTQAEAERLQLAAQSHFYITASEVFGII